MWTEEASKAIRFLASCPGGRTTLETTDLKQLLLETGGTTLSCGRLYNIDSKHLGAGAYQVSLSLANP